jgi:hypothetical protein
MQTRDWLGVFAMLLLLLTAEKPVPYGLKTRLQGAVRGLSEYVALVDVGAAEPAAEVSRFFVEAEGTPSSFSRGLQASENNPSTNPEPNKSAQVYNSIQQMSGWYTSPDQGHPVCSHKPELVSNPSMDGRSGEFYLEPKGRYNNCLWPLKLGESSKVSHFLLDTYYQLSNPAVSQGVEFSSNHHVGPKWYKFSVQCSYNKGIFSIWDTAGKHWSATDIPCNRPKPNSWDHLVVETQISGGKAVFLSLTLNGVQHLINKSFDPLTKPSSYSYGVHFQMNGDVAGHPYYAWVDKMTFTVW